MASQIQETDSNHSSSIVSLFVRHPNAPNLLMVLMVIAGLFALAKINTQFFPTLEVKTISINVAWSGASAEDVEANILEIMEPELRFLDGVDKTTSYAREGSGSVVLEYKPDTDMQAAVRDAESAVKAITNLPEDSETPKVSQIQFFDRVARLAITGNVPETALRIYAKIIRDDLIARGIDKVSFVGMRDRELRVDLPERELRRLGMNIADVSRTISQNSRDLPSGQVKGEVEKQLRALAQFKDPNLLGDLEIRALADGQKIRLRDIATILETYDDDQAQGFSDGNRAIQLTVERAVTADTLKTSKILDDYLTDIADVLPKSIQIKKYEVRADALVERISLLVRNGLGGLVLVVAILFIFLNARVAFWVAAGIPVAMLATIGVMYVMGQTINMISLFALIMMLGVIVDDAIVVGEHTASLSSAGMGALDAAEQGAGRMITPVFAAMITTIAAFAPMLMIGDVIGQIMGAMPLVVIAVIIASLVECFLILPGHLAHSLKPRKKRQWSIWRHFILAVLIGLLLTVLSSRLGTSQALASGPWWGVAQLTKLHENYSLMQFSLIVAAIAICIAGCIEFFIYLARRLTASITGSADDTMQEPSWFRRMFDAGFNWFRDGMFKQLVGLSFRYRYVTVAIAIGSIMVVVFGLWIFGGHMKFVFFPSPESENIRARIVFNAGVDEGKAKQLLEKIEHSLYETVDEVGKGEELITAVFSTLGTAGRNTGDNLAQINVQLTVSERRTIRTPVIVNAWRKRVPKLAGIRKVSVFAPRGGPPGRDIEIEIYGQKVAELKRMTGAISDMVASIPGATGVADDLPYGKPELIMQLLPRGSALGFSIEDVGKQVRDAFEGAIPRRFADGDDEVTIRLKLSSGDQGISALRNFELKTKQNQFVPLSEVVSLTERQGFASIVRREGKTNITVTANLDSKLNTTEQAIEQLEQGGIHELLEKNSLQYSYAGRAKERQKAFADLKIGVIVALSIIYIVLAWVFSDYWRPIAIMLIIPFGIVGAVFGHWMMGYDLTILSLIGLLGLSGILVNDSIILVSRLDERIGMGEDLENAAIGASCDRLRAVLLTSLTTIGGLIPLMFEKSLQAQFLLPMAITIVFGLTLATLLVLFLVPAIIGIGSDIGNLLRWSFFADKTSRARA